MKLYAFRKLRLDIFAKRGRKCQRCGWDEINPVTGKSPVEVDHIDGNKSNLSDSNLIVLCPNCHSLTATYKHNRKHTKAARERIKKTLKSHYAAKA